MDTLVMLRGGHTTVVKDQTPQQIENELRLFCQSRSELTNRYQMFYIQTSNRGDNGLCIDPDSIVALVAVP